MFVNAHANLVAAVVERREDVAAQEKEDAPMSTLAPRRDAETSVFAVVVVKAVALAVLSEDVEKDVVVREDAEPSRDAAKDARVVADAVVSESAVKVENAVVAVDAVV